MIVQTILKCSVEKYKEIHVNYNARQVALHASQYSYRCIKIVTPNCIALTRKAAASRRCAISIANASRAH